MLAWFRARSRSLASAALVSLVTLTLGSALPHPDDCHEAACGASLPHDPSSHRMAGSSGSAEHTLHCVLCHWTRWVRPGESAPTHRADVEIVARTVVHLTWAPQQFSAAQPPLRAPPTAPSLV